jgi:peptidoglycan/LPS O-acetylase OafA/YrhL
MIDYRREIDGLRALAVLPVIFFHAGIRPFSGGFVGVDIFFVISGYLITSIILSEMTTGTFSLKTFYERRARRILPALFFITALCIPFGFLWLLPIDMKDLSQSLVAVSVFASNILFWREQGYFNMAAEHKPLLHTWSLAVEEQYYVLFPLFILLAWRFGKRWLVVLLSVIAFASLAIAQWGAYNKPAAAFYLLPARGWELAIGVLIAFYMANKEPKPTNTLSRQALSALGLLLITYAIFWYNKTTPFPSLYALVPTIGAALLILFATPSTLVGRFLGSKVLVGIGLISYSAYLWHQILFAFLRHRSLLAPSQSLYELASISAIGLAYFTWRYVERPFRQKSFVSRRVVVALAVGGSATFFAVGLIGHFSNGSFGRTEKFDQLLKLQERVRPNRGLNEECEGAFTLSAKCRTSDEPEILVWGDSYAMQLVEGLLASEPTAKVIQATVSVCGPILDLAPINQSYVRPWAEDCMKTNDRVYQLLKTSKTIKYVLMSSAFGQYIGDGATVLLRDGRVASGGDITYQYMIDTLSRIRSLGITPVIFSPTPQNGQDIGRCLVKAAYFGHSVTYCDINYDVSEQQQKIVFDFLRKISLVSQVVWLPDGICSDGECKAAIGDVFIYRDRAHLSYEGSAYIGRKMNFYDIVRGK